MRAEDYEIIKLDIQGELAVATLQGSEGGNLYPAEGYAEFVRLACDLRDDLVVRTLVITASGPDDVFSLGSIPNIGPHPDRLHSADLSQQPFRRAIKEFLDIEKPVITA